MKRASLLLLLAVLAAPASPAATPAAGSRPAAAPAASASPGYRLEFAICGGAISRVLLLFPLRVYYETTAAVDLESALGEDGSLRFAFSGMPRPAYVLRTLGFAGKTLALMAVDGGGEGFVPSLLAGWRRHSPEFASRIERVKTFFHSLRQTGPQPFAFRRDADGVYRDIACGLEPRYRHHPARTGIYFNAFPLLADLLLLLNQRVLPPGEDGAAMAALPASWSGDELDLSADLNHLAGLLEKAVPSLVTVEQKRPFRLRYQVAPGAEGGREICGEAYPDVAVWKGFMIREMIRRLRLDAQGRLLSDEIWLGLRARNGQGGWGFLRLARAKAIGG